MQTPSEVLYSDLRSFAGINNRDAARILLSERSEGKGVAPRLRIEDKTYLSRNVVHVPCGKADPAMFADFNQSVQRLASLILSRTREMGVDPEEVYLHYRTTAADEMAQALFDCGREWAICLNTIDRINAQETIKTSDRFLMNLLTFIVCGCIADPTEAANEVRRFARNKLSFTFTTLDTTGQPEGHVLPTLQLSDDEDSSCSQDLGLLRLSRAGGALPPIYPLARDETGTVIGSYVEGERAINNVGVDVSHRHLRISYAGDCWYATGLGSTNGSTLTSEDGVTEVIEAPQSERGEGETRNMVPIKSGDVIALGNTTRFLVLKVSSGSRALINGL